MDLYQQQARNRWATIGLLAAFTALLGGLGVAVHLSMPIEVPVSAGGVALPVPIVPVGVVVFSALTSWVSYFHGDRIVLATMRARRLDPKALKERQLQNVAEEMALASGLPVPALYVVPDDDLNAFATGRSPAHASLAVTEGLLDALDREELQAVVAHEMGHIRNLDIRTMMIVGVLLGAVALLGDMLVHMGGNGRDRRNKGGSLPLVLIGFVTPLIARLIATAVSRTREFEADRSAAEFTRNPMALVRALDKLEGAKAPTRYASQGSAHMFIVDPRVSAINDREDWLGNMFATHPPIQARIKRLQAMGYDRTEASIAG